MKAALWARVSNDRQETENQIRQLREVADRRGWEVAETYFVEASAWKGRYRPDLERPVAYAGIRARYELFEARTYGPVGGATSAPYHPRNERRLQGLQSEIDGAIAVLEKLAHRGH